VWVGLIALAHHIDRHRNGDLLAALSDDINAVVIQPLIVLAIGTALVWAIRGFRS
jgi:hypothetical protein